MVPSSWLPSHQTTGGTPRSGPKTIPCWLLLASRRTPTATSTFSASSLLPSQQAALTTTSLSPSNPYVLPSLQPNPPLRPSNLPTTPLRPPQLPSSRKPLNTNPTSS